ncbi:TPA: ead/Ea22-like family protein [Escherichia coli]|nr:ead/Ea22-like family protein [Escherichia coli]
MKALNKQALREAAEKATGAHDRLSVMPADDIFDISLHEGTQLDADITDLNAFNETASPAAVLALLDELEAAEKRIAELERKEQHSDRQSVIDALASSGEEWSDIEEYMQKWDAERAAAAGKGE